MILYYQIFGAIFGASLFFFLFWGWVYNWPKKDPVAGMIGVIMILAFLFLLGGGIYQLIGRIF